MPDRAHCSYVSIFNMQLRLWTSNNKRITKHLSSPDQLLTMRSVPEDCNTCRILVNLDLLDDYYHKKFIEPNLDRYCQQLIDALLKTVHFVLSEPDPYIITYEIKSKGKYRVKHVMYSFGAVMY